ncbi:MAG: hypothetical protein HKN40_10405 [Winogradskyella sp.]|uniref:DUF6452 family protein n=1 Tax=Winogradskyella sp. TaxID=1883156 RepID=UPI0017BB260E|nr:hypothetical protein [Winogradskyella sp.]
MKRFVLFILITFVMLTNCERDDICAESTSTTPRLIIEFYDASNPDILKDVPRLTVYGEGLITDPVERTDATLKFNENSSLVEFPLKIEAENQTVTTRFILEKDTNLRLDTNNATDSNVDIIQISYIPEFKYVSRACGYKSIFTNLIVQNTLDGSTWISGIEVDELIVDNENTVHVRILH